MEPTDLDVVLNQVLAGFKRAIQDSSAVITRDPLLTVMADPKQMTQLLQHLIENAIKFRPAQKDASNDQETLCIHVSAERKGNEWLFAVSDNGIGIEPQYTERIFVIFQCLHSRAEYPGTGIGLAICKRIVERHGGRMWVQSQLGQGATFYFSIPAEQVL